MVWVIIENTFTAIKVLLKVIYQRNGNKNENTEHINIFIDI